MTNKKLKIDKIYLLAIVLLTIAGFFIFSSASLGLLARDGASFQSVAVKQTLGLILGIVAFFVMSRVYYKNLRKYSFYILVGAIVLNLLLFLPFLSLNHGGASRWIDFGFITFQPSEFLKIAFIIYFSAWLSGLREKVETFKYGIVPYAALLIVLGLILLAQSDTDTFVVIAGTGLIMLLVAGGKVRNILLIGLIFAILVGIVAYVRPYARARIMTFFNQSSDIQGAGYQIQQSLIAIGSGKTTGRGFGQSIQKFDYLPEPIGDSIFAVSAEEFGFIGSLILIALFLLFFIRSIKIAVNSQDPFGGLTVLGIAILIIVESFMNISSMLGLIPLSGMPLLFVSHGGTALIIILGAAGIIANISKYQKTI
jgi:cell division protein FtsW